MGLIKEARERHGVGLRELARRLDVSPATVQSWERADARGTSRISTIDKALRAVGERVEIVTESVDLPARLERREDRVSLELHRSVAHHLIEDPEGTLGPAFDNIRERRRNSHGAASRAVLDEWEHLIAGHRIGSLVDVFIGTSRHAINMRQLSPFAGTLSRGERLAAIRRASEA